MDSIRRFGLRLNTRYLIFGLVIWWLAMIIGYSIITFRTDRYRNQLSKSGIEIAHEFSDLISLPLLEKKDQAIRTLLADAAKRTDVIYASVVDHQDKVVAFLPAPDILCQTRPKRYVPSKRYRFGKVDLRARQKF